jgi:hypothetical protein
MLQPNRNKTKKELFGTKKENSSSDEKAQKDFEQRSKTNKAYNKTSAGKKTKSDSPEAHEEYKKGLGKFSANENTKNFVSNKKK